MRITLVDGKNRRLSKYGSYRKFIIFHHLSCLKLSKNRLCAHNIYAWIMMIPLGSLLLEVEIRMTLKDCFIIVLHLFIFWLDEKRYAVDIWNEISKFMGEISMVILAMTCRWFNPTMIEDSIYKFACLHDLHWKLKSREEFREVVSLLEKIVHDSR